MPLKDTFDKLKTSIIGTKTSSLDTKLDQAVKDIVAYKSQSGRNSHIELIKHLITLSQGYNIDAQTGGGLFNQASLSPATFGQSRRLQRYKTYESIIYNISYAYRALSVLVDNILSPDDITKVSLDIKPVNYIEDQGQGDEVNKTKVIRETIETLKLESHLHRIIRNTLAYGDFFCEIADAKTALTSRAIISEALVNNKYSDSIQVSEKDVNFSKVIIDYSAFLEQEESSDKNSKNKKDKLEAKDLTLVFHEPRKVLKLQSELFPLCFGYLVFPSYSIVPGDVVQDQAVNNICMSILKSLESKVPQIKDFGDVEDLKDIIRSMVKSSDFSRALNVRFVPADKIEHFHIPYSRYYPYGESVFDACQYNAKVLIALETALAIQRLSRSTEKRKIAVEIGLPRDAATMVEKLKEEFRKRKISLDSFGTIDTIPSFITTFEDIYIPQRDGKPYVDVSNFNEGMTDVRGKVDELKFMRDSVVANLGVPASFLNIEENLCSALYNHIKLCDGRSITLQQIIDEFESGKENYVYSYDPEKGMIFPNKISWAGKTRLNTQLVRIYLDNDKSADFTPDHLFMLRDGSYKEVKDLKEGDSLMSLNSLNHKVLKVEYLEGLYDTGDIKVEKHSNFAVAAGVIVHNSNKSALSEENVLFARTVISHQKYFSSQLSELTTKIFKIITPEDYQITLADVSISLLPPKSLQFEREARYMGDLANLIRTLDEIGIPKEWSKKKYLSGIDWADLKNYETSDKIDKSLTPPSEEEAGGLAGLGGMGGGF